MNSSPQNGSRAQYVGRYKLIKTVGRGQFGKVKLAVNSQTGEKVALKIIAKKRLEANALKMVKREVMIMKLLVHENIVRLYEVLENDDFLILVMEYASGGEVIDFIIAHGKLKESVARQFFRQIVMAMSYCHSLNVIHRDLKPENLLLDHQFRIKIIDFGLSNYAQAGGLLKTFCGSPTYTAPELILQQPYLGPGIDVWSLGVVLFVLVCGYLPFDGQNFQELFQKIIAGDYVIPPFLTDDCVNLIKRMLVVDPTKRATLEEVLKNPWLTCNGGPLPTVVKPNCFSKVGRIEDVDHEIIVEIASAVNVAPTDIIESIMRGDFDDVATIYWLLVLHKEQKQGVEKQTAASNAMAAKQGLLDSHTLSPTPPHSPTKQMIINLASSSPAGTARSSHHAVHPRSNPAPRHASASPKRKKATDPTPVSQTIEEVAEPPNPPTPHRHDDPATIVVEKKLYESNGKTHVETNGHHKNGVTKQTTTQPPVADIKPVLTLQKEQAEPIVIPPLVIPQNVHEQPVDLPHIQVASPQGTPSGGRANTATKGKSRGHRRCRTEGESTSKVAEGGERTYVRSTSTKRSGPIVPPTPPAEETKRTSPVRSLFKTPEKATPETLSPDANEDLIIPFEITPPRIPGARPSTDANKMKDLATSFRQTFGQLMDSDPMAPLADGETLPNSPKPREVRIPVHHRTISTDVPGLLCSSCGSSKNFS